MPEQLSRAVAYKWRRLMKYQTALLFPMELAFYHRRQEWHNASSVVDLGTGNGYYLFKLASHFPLKQYTGIDFSGTNIKAATKYYRKHWEGPKNNVTFLV
jgi:tRNA G46 methylase TrmB